MIVDVDVVVALVDGGCAAFGVALIRVALLYVFSFWLGVSPLRGLLQHCCRSSPRSGTMCVEPVLEHSAKQQHVQAERNKNASANACLRSAPAEETKPCSLSDGACMTS